MCWTAVFLPVCIWCDDDSQENLIGTNRRGKTIGRASGETLRIPLIMENKRNNKADSDNKHNHPVFHVTHSCQSSFQH
jgi:hypothetical protein